MALASYNIGYAHVEDARVLAQRLKLNPDSWADVKKTLVMLTDPKYYVNAKVWLLQLWCTSHFRGIYSQLLQHFKAFRTQL